MTSEITRREHISTAEEAIKKLRVCPKIAQVLTPELFNFL